MPRRRDAGLFEVLFDAVSLLPPWVGVLLALIAYGWLHHYAIMKVPAGITMEQKSQAIGRQLAVSMAGVFQYVFPLLLLAAATRSARSRRKRAGLLQDVARDPSGAALRNMSWRDFELLVGEAFRRRGYAVTETGGGGADDGIDLRLQKGGETFLVQCKQWRAYKVSVRIVRELFGVTAAHGATGGFVVTTGVFTAEARAFARGRNIELLDGPALLSLTRGLRAPTAAPSPTITQTTPTMPLVPLTSAEAPTCPRCGQPMARRTATRGASAGRDFWGCTAYPRCRGTRPIA